MDLGPLNDIVGPVSAAVGQVAHVVKKRMESEKGNRTEIDILKEWVMKKPFNTLGAIIGALAAAQLTVVDGSGFITQIAAGFATGFAANSAINRPGQ